MSQGRAEFQHLGTGACKASHPCLLEAGCAEVEAVGGRFFDLVRLATALRTIAASANLQYQAASPEPQVTPDQVALPARQQGLQGHSIASRSCRRQRDTKGASQEQYRPVK